MIFNHFQISQRILSLLSKGLLTFAVCLLLPMCSLDEHPKDQIEVEIAYNSVEDLYRNTVATLYYYVGGNTDGQGLQGTCRGIYDLQTFGSDEALIPKRGTDWYDGGIWRQLYCHSWSGGHEIVGNSWMYLYKVIALCNRSLETIEQNKDILTRIQYQRYTSEVKAFRAIYYWYLLDLFGNVPIVTATNISINDVAQSSRSVVFDFVRSEIENAVPYLPNRNSVEKGEYYGRVTQAVAFFVLAKLYLNAEIYADDDWTDHKHLNGSDLHFTISGKDMNAWEACAFYCDIIGQMNYHLSEDYADNFIVYNENSVENIWTIPMDKDLYSNQQQYLFRSYHYRHAAAFGFGGENGTCASLKVLEVNHYGKADQDTRFGRNYWSGEATGLNSSIVTDRQGNNLIYYPLEVSIDLSNSPYMETAGARMKKYEVDRFATNDGKLMDNDIVLFRYADVLLMLAEAKVRNGEDGQSYFDLVRKRARMNTLPATLENILNERMIEFAWEGWRRNDMIRFDIYKSTYEGADAVDESDRHTIVFPIPNDVLSLNTNLHQNPGY